MPKNHPVRQPSRRAQRNRWRALVLFVATTFVGTILFAAAADGGWLRLAYAEPAPARNRVMTAWRQVRDAGAYRFSADIEQEVVPLPTVGNVGRASKIQRLYLQGDTDLAAQRLQLAIWSQGGSVLDVNSAAQLTVEGDKAFVRQGEGEWQETQNFTGGFAPEGDFLAFLHAAKNLSLIHI